MDWLERQRRLLALKLQQGKENVRDVFDANTKADQERRVKAGQARYYQDQQAQKKAAQQNNFRISQQYNKPVLRVESTQPKQKRQPNFLERNLSTTGLSNIGKETFPNLARFANTLQAGTDTVKQTVVESPKMFAAGLTRNKGAMDASTGRIKKELADSLGSTGGIFNVGTMFDEEKSIGDNLKRTAASTLGLAGEVVPVGKGIQLGKQGLKAGMKQGAKLVSQGAGAAAAASAGEQYVRTGEVKPQDVAISAVTGGGLTGIVGAAGATIQRLVTNRNIKKVERELEKTFPGLFGRDLNRAAKKIAKSTDENEITKIINDYVETGKLADDTPTTQPTPSTPESATPPLTTEKPAVSDTVATELSKNKSPEEIKLAVKALLPELPDSEVNALATQLAKTTDTEETKKLVQEARDRADAQFIQKVQEQAPDGQRVDQATQQTEIAQEASPVTAPSGDVQTSAQPTGQQVAQEPTTTSPMGVEGATTADNVPGATTPPVGKTPKTVKLWQKSKFSDRGAYVDVPVIRRVDNKTLYQGGSADGRQYWTENKKYAEQFGDVTEKTGSFYEVDNGNRVTTVYVEANPKPTPVAPVGKTASDTVEGVAPSVAPRVADDMPIEPDLTAPVPQSFSEMVGEKAGKLWQRVKEQLYDPLAPWQRLEDNRNKVLKVKMKDADASRSFTHLLNKIVVSDQDTVRNLTAVQPSGQSVADVFAKYPDVTVRDGVEENGFVQYLQARFFGEIYEKSGGKIWKAQNYSPEQAQKYIADFEAQNPTARVDADTMKQWADSKVDAKVASREITPEHGENIKNAYTVFTPLDQAKDPDLVSTTISGGRGGVGTERIAQNLTEATGDYDTSWKSVFNRERRYNSETAENNLSLELDRSIREGSLTREADDVYIVVDPEKQAQRAEVVSRMDELRAKIDIAKKGRGKLATQKRLSKKDLVQAQTEAAELARQYYIIQATDDAGIAFAKKMSRAELLDMFDVLTGANEIKASRVINKLKKRGGEYERVSAQLQSTRDDIAIMRAEASGDWKLAAQLNEKKPKFDNVIPYYKDGQKGYIHISSDMARVRNDMKKMADNSTAAKVVKGAANAQKWLFTGGGAPVFKLVTNPIRSQVQAYTLAPGMSAFGGRPIAQGIKTVFSKKTSDAYMQKLMDYGFSPEVATKTSFQQSRGVEQVASMSSKGERAKYLSKHWGELFNVLNSGMAKMDNAARMQVARGVELRMRRRHPDWSEDQIMSAAARAGNDILGNFNRVSKLARDVEPLLLYSGATQSGFRQMMRTFRERPIETGAKVVSLVGAVAGSAMFMLSMGDDDYNETMKEYYDQKIASGNTSELDSNLIIGIPGMVDYDEATNTWKGIVKVPIPPDYKPLVRASWKTAYDIVTNGKFDPAMIGRELANFSTADQSSNIRNPKTGMLFPSSPVGTAGRLAFGQDPRTGKQLETEYEKTQPRTERYNKYTSDLAKTFSRVTNGAFTPKMIDAILSQSGYFGSKLKSIEDGEQMGALKSIVNDFTSKVYGSKGFSEKQQKGKSYSEDIDAVSKGFSDQKQYQLWVANITKRKDDKTNLDSAAKALMLLDNKEVLGAEIEMNRRQFERTGNSNPLYDNTLTTEQRDRVLMYRSMKAQNAAKQNYTKDGESAFISLGLDEPWYQEFKDKENAFYAAVTEDGDVTFKTFSGKDKPTASPELQQKLDYYYTLPKGTGDRSAFLKANQDVLNFWSAQNDFTNAERAALGFKPLNDEEQSTTTGRSGYNKFGYGGGSQTIADKLSPNLTKLISGIDTGTVRMPQIDVVPPKTKFKVKLPSSSKGRNYKRIRLQ